MQGPLVIDFGGLECVKESLLEEGELCATKHLSLDQLELVNLSLDWSITIDLCKSGDNGLFVTENTKGKAL